VVWPPFFSGEKNYFEGKINRSLIGNHFGGIEVIFG